MAVYTRISDTAARDFLGAYGLAEKFRRMEPIETGIENTNYRVRLADRILILTLFERRVKRADLPYFLGFADHLSARGLPAPETLRDRDGNRVRTLSGKATVLTEHMPGKALPAPGTGETRAMGSMLAKCHRAGRDFKMTRRNDMDLAGLSDILSRFSARDRQSREWARLAEDEVCQLSAQQHEWLPGGPVHLDFFPDNVLWEKRRISGLIDFYFAADEDWVYDLAVTLGAWCFGEDNSLSVKRVKALLAGYRAERELEKAEWDALPAACRRAALRFLVTRLEDWNRPVGRAMVTPKNPGEYAEKLRCFRELDWDRLKDDGG